MSNKSLGDSFEVAFSKMLRDAGFWVHRLKGNSSGQPADIIAAKNRKTFLIDCKVCTNNEFKLSRIEDNQRLAMTLWKETGNGVGLFALELDDDVVIISADALFPLEQSVLKRDDIYRLGIGISGWILWQMKN